MATVATGRATAADAGPLKVSPSHWPGTVAAVLSDADIVAALRKVTGSLPNGGEERPGQVEMALAVAHAIRTKRHLIVQAGTGTGKSLGYLVPSILLGVNLVVATATKALQDQLAQRDLPLLSAHLGRTFSFAVLKGRSNYLCRQRLAEIGSAPEELGLDTSSGARTGSLGEEVRRLVEWSRTTSIGDRAELDFEPRPAAWQAVSVTSEECPGAARCPRGDECLAEAARNRAGAADVVVVNTHLYAAHLASGGNVLPEHDVVVFDEAHELEDVMAAGLGLEVGPGRLRALARTARTAASGAALTAAADALSDTADRLESVLAAAGSGRLAAPLPDEVADALSRAESRVEAVVAAVRDAGGAASDDGSAARTRLLQAATNLIEDLRVAARIDDARVAWVEGGPRNPALKVALVDVGALLYDGVWSHATAVLTSATLASGTAARVGLPSTEHDALDVGSPFPYERNALLYCAVHLPDPRHAAYEPSVHEELLALITAAGGRTLGLFTSWRAMHAAADALRDRVPGRLLTQADLPKPALVDAFRSDESTSLFATLGFFQGVDVPGRTLSLVTLDRLPFPRPDDPLTQARRDRAGDAAFSVVDLPRAATLLAQGVGRLIRSATDRGVVAVFDPRLGRASYRWLLVNALPPMRRTRDRAEAEGFLRTITGSPDAPEPADGAASPGRP